MCLVTLFLYQIYIWCYFLSNVYSKSSVIFLDYYQCSNRAPGCILLVFPRATRQFSDPSHFWIGIRHSNVISILSIITEISSFDLFRPAFIVLIGFMLGFADAGWQTQVLYRKIYVIFMILSQVYTALGEYYASNAANAFAIFKCVQVNEMANLANRCFVIHVVKGVGQNRERSSPYYLVGNEITSYSDCQWNDAYFSVPGSLDFVRVQLDCGSAPATRHSDRFRPDRRWTLRLLRIQQSTTLSECTIMYNIWNECFSLHNCDIIDRRERRYSKINAIRLVSFVLGLTISLLLRSISNYGMNIDFTLQLVI